jgi:hypothetical protein
MNPPHIMIFANNYPNLEFLTEDRWDVREIKLTNDESIVIESQKDETVVENAPGQDQN